MYTATPDRLRPHWVICCVAVWDQRMRKSAILRIICEEGNLGRCLTSASSLCICLYVSSVILNNFEPREAPTVLYHDVILPPSRTVRSKSHLFHSTATRATERLLYNHVTPFDAILQQFPNYADSPSLLYRWNSAICAAVWSFSRQTYLSINAEYKGRQSAYTFI